MTNQDGIGVLIENDEKGGPYFFGFLDSIDDFKREQIAKLFKSKPQDND